MKFSEKVLRARKQLGLSQAQLAEKVGISPQTQMKYEHGKNSPTVDYLLSLGALGVDLARLLGLDDEHSADTPSSISTETAINAFKETDSEGRTEDGELLDYGIRFRIFKSKLQM